MTLVRLTLRNLAGNAFRSWTVFLCALVVAGLTLSATLILRGAESSLRLALERLGADIVVVPQGAEAKVETALLMGTPAGAMRKDGTYPPHTVHGLAMKRIKEMDEAMKEESDSGDDVIRISGNQCAEFPEPTADLLNAAMPTCGTDT